jgi:hypothetical protein
VLAIPVVALLGIGWLRAGPRHRRAGAGFLGLLALLAFFATAMDLVHLAFIKSFFGSRLVLELIEEGGEMITLSAALLLALGLARRLPDPLPVPEYRPAELARSIPPRAGGAPIA